MILETLESVRWQVEKYAAPEDAQLIIGDDGSQDETPYLIKAWCQEHKHCFAEIVLELSDKNHGTCQNFINTLRHVRGEWVSSLAGDDILPYDSLYDVVKRHHKADVIGVNSLTFNEKGLVDNSAVYRGVLKQACYTSELARFMTLHGYFCIVNGALWRSSLISNKLLEALKGYTLVEDRIQWVTIYKEHPEAVFEYDPCVGLLYRINENSVTHSKNLCNRHVADIRRFYREVGRSASWCTNLSVWFLQRQLEGHRWAIYLNPYNYFLKWLEWHNRHQIEKNLSFLLSRKSVNDIYMNKIKKSARKSGNKYHQSKRDYREDLV